MVINLEEIYRMKTITSFKSFYSLIFESVFFNQPSPSVEHDLYPIHLRTYALHLVYSLSNHKAHKTPRIDDAFQESTTHAVLFTFSHGLPHPVCIIFSPLRISHIGCLKCKLNDDVHTIPVIWSQFGRFQMSNPRGGWNSIVRSFMSATTLFVSAGAKHII